MNNTPRTTLRQRKSTRKQWMLLCGVLGVAVGALSTTLHDYWESLSSPVNYYGETVKIADSVNRSLGFDSSVAPDVVKPFYDCKLGYMGQNPWVTEKTWTPKRRANTVRAFIMLGMSREGAEKATETVEKRLPEDVLTVTNEGSTGRYGVRYGRIFDTTFNSPKNGPAVCYHSKTIFPSKNPKTYAMVWKVFDHGRLFTLGVFLDCDNVSRFYLEGEYPPTDYPPLIPDVPRSESEDNSNNGEQRVNKVDEPGGWALMGVSLFLLWVFRKKENKQ